MKCKTKFRLRRTVQASEYLYVIEIFTGQLAIVHQLIRRYRPRYALAQQWFADAGLVLTPIMALIPAVTFITVNRVSFDNY